MKLIVNEDRIFRKKTVAGELAKYRLKYIHSDEDNGVVIVDKLILTDKPTSDLIINRLEKTYKGKYLYRQIMSFTFDTFIELVAPIVFYKKKIHEQNS